LKIGSIIETTMGVWKPKTHITLKVLGLVWRGPELLAFEVTDSEGRTKGIRPLGGGIEFGETREQAMRREFREELACGATIVGPWHFIENIFEHEGNIGHQMMCVADVELDDRSIYEKDLIEFLENDGTVCSAGWFNPNLLPDEVELYPNGLSTLIEGGLVGRQRGLSPCGTTF
jgi:ADP-ribose pyrophosphatase YjhB (NUDIX family)